ncbi:MAG: biotin/lipoyl-containing protein [Rhodothermales bacterium]
MPDSKTPYLVELDAAAALPVDPGAHDPSDTGLIRVRDHHYLLRFRGTCMPVTVEYVGKRDIRLWSGNRVFSATVQDERDQLLAEWGFAAGGDSEVLELVAPMPGLVLSVLVSDGETVDVGQPLLVLEAMKMENELRAEKGATVRSVRVQAGDAVTKAQVLIEFES